MKWVGICGTKLNSRSEEIFSRREEIEGIGKENN
jgi:hypothetical protein